jgi:hypothetical protein
MPFLLRVALPDVPGSLGRLATAIGAAGGSIEAIEIVEKRHDGTAVDDVLLEMSPGAMPDSVVSACTALDGVEVVWISRYAAGGNLFLDLEVVEELTGNPEKAMDTLVGLLPVTFRVDWAARLQRTSDGGSAVTMATGAAPHEIGWAEIDRATRLPDVDDHTVHCGVPLGDEALVVLGRAGGPGFLDSELARLEHLVALARSISRSFTG